jgi:hypothetical protein
MRRYREEVCMLVDVRTLSSEGKFAFACFLVAEINRHRKDIENAEADLEALRAMGIPVDAAYDMGFISCRGDENG